MNERYSERGVSADKSEVHHAIKHLSKGIFPNAFCKVLPDLVGGDEGYCNVMHADTAGTKTSLAYAYWKETGDLSVWDGIIQDAFVMNLDDLICVGITDNIVFSSTIGRNKHYVTGEVLNQLIGATQRWIEKLQGLGVGTYLSGGETADVGDIVRTLDVGFTAFARVPKSDIIETQIKPGAVIVGLASFGKATYEDAYNSGIGSNGLTSARHDVFHNYLKRRYPETFDENIPEHLVYSGSKLLTEKEPETGLTYGQLVLSPTRTYSPVVKKILELDRTQIQSIIHCSGGAQTKVLKFAEGVKVVKDNLFNPPPIFKVIQKESGTEWKEMYKVFNMGHRLEVYTNESFAERVIEIANQFDIEARVIGRVEPSAESEVMIVSNQGTFSYKN